MPEEGERGSGIEGPDGGGGEERARCQWGKGRSGEGVMKENNFEGKSEIVPS